MIPKINSATSFKAFFIPNDLRFSESQQAVIKDIENKLGDRVDRKDFCVLPHEDNAVGLYKVSNPRVNLFNNKLKFDKIRLYTVCDEWHPFDVEKYEVFHGTPQLIMCDNDEIDLEYLTVNVIDEFEVLVPLTVLATALAVFSNLKSSKNLSKTQTELIQNFDTLKENLAKDTLDLTKRFIK